MQVTTQTFILSFAWVWVAKGLGLDMQPAMVADACAYWMRARRSKIGGG